MKKIGDITNTADKNGEFTDGNVAAGTPPTQLMGAWFNSVQREILNVLAKAGIPQSATKEDQLAEAIIQIISNGKYASTTYVDNGLNKKIDKANISGQKGNDNDKVPSLNLLTTEIGKLQPKGDYATNEALNNGLNTKLNTSSVVQGTGTSITQVISQNGVSKALASKADSKVFIAETDIGNSAISPIAGSGSLVISKSGGFYVFVPSAGHVFKVNAEGVLERGVVPYSNVSGAPLLGVGQKWKTVTKQINTLYTNTTQKPIFVFAKSNASSNNFKIELEVDGVIASSTMVNGSGGNGTVTKELSCGAIVPSQSSYKFLVGGVEPAGVSISYAAELS